MILTEDPIHMNWTESHSDFVCPLGSWLRSSPFSWQKTPYLCTLALTKFLLEFYETTHPFLRTKMLLSCPNLKSKSNGTYKENFQENFSFWQMTAGNECGICDLRCVPYFFSLYYYFWVGVIRRETAKLTRKEWARRLEFLRICTWFRKQCRRFISYTHWWFLVYSRGVFNCLNKFNKPK